MIAGHRTFFFLGACIADGYAAVPFVGVVVDGGWLCVEQQGHRCFF